jgi:type III restriction enzyme
MFLENLQKELIGEGIITEGVEKREIRLKEHFVNSHTYKNGFVLMNKTEKRQKTTDDEKSTAFEKILTINSYELMAR